MSNVIDIKTRKQPDNLSLCAEVFVGGERYMISRELIDSLALGDTVITEYKDIDMIATIMALVIKGVFDGYN